MPKDTNNRLDKLQREIYEFMKLHKQKRRALLEHPTASTAVIFNVEEASSRITINGSTTSWVQPFAQSTGTSRRPCRSDDANLYKFRSRTLTSTSQPCSCREERALHPATKYELDELGTRRSNKSSRSSAKTYNEMQAKLLKEQVKLDETYRTINELGEELELYKKKNDSLVKDKEVLSNAYKLLHSKYKQMKMACQKNSSQCDAQRKLNSELCKKLDNKCKEHTETMNGLKVKLAKEFEQKLKEEFGAIVKRTEEHHRKLQEANETLASNNCRLHCELEDASQEIVQLKKKLTEKCTNLQTNFTEINELKLELNNEKNKNIALTSEINVLEDKIEEIRNSQRASQDEISSLENKIQDLEANRRKSIEDSANKLKDYEVMKKECEKLREKMARVSEEYDKRYVKIEQEMQELLKTMKEREKVLLRDKEALTKLVEELSEVIRSHKNRINDLININKQQEKLLQSQMIVLQNKEEQTQLAEAEALNLKEKSEKLHNELQTLRELIEKHKKQNNCKCEAQLNTLKNELKQTKNALQEEKDKLLVKEKIVEDQADTIQNLKTKNKGQEVKKQTEEIARLQKQLDSERHAKDKLMHNIREMERYSDRLKKQIDMLSRRLQKHTNTERNFINQNKMLDSLETQIQIKQREWELQCEMLNKEKERAVQAARFATQKLVDTVSDFRAHTTEQKRVHALLASIVRENSHANINQRQVCECR